MSGRLAAVALAVSVAVAACGVPSQDAPHVVRDAALPPEPATTRPVAPSGVDANVYLVLRDRPVPVVRRTAGTGLDDVLDALVDGPTDDEVAAGLRTALPEGVTIEASGVNGNGVATIEIGPLLDGITGEEQILVFAQLVLTAAGVDGVEAVVFVRDGERIDAPTVDGTLVSRPVTAADYDALLERPTGPGT